MYFVYTIHYNKYLLDLLINKCVVYKHNHIMFVVVECTDVM